MIDQTNCAYYNLKRKVLEDVKREKDVERQKEAEQNISQTPTRSAIAKENTENTPFTMNTSGSKDSEEMPDGTNEAEKEKLVEESSRIPHETVDGESGSVEATEDNNAKSLAIPGGNDIRTASNDEGDDVSTEDIEERILNLVSAAVDAVTEDDLLDNRKAGQGDAFRVRYMEVIK